MSRACLFFLVALSFASLSFASLPSARAAPQQKFALAVMHFNIQYVAGGMVGFSPKANPITDLSAEAIEDQIIVESFEPVLDLYAKHPTWGCDLEMQAYMLDVIGARHPGVLAKLKALAVSGQVEVLSFHYGDQLFLANAVDDWSRSNDLVHATFDKWGVPLGKAVFCQEGQAGVGMAAMMKDRGYQTLVWPKNLYGYQYGDVPAPLYQFGDVNMIVSRGGVDAATGIDVQWTFLDDGELLATGGVDPYFPAQFKKSIDALDKYEGSVIALEQAGYAVTTVSKYVTAVLPQVVTPPMTPVLLDGTWQPNSTNGIHKWLGGRGIWGESERDNDVHTLQWMAHRELEAAETIAKQAGAAFQMDAQVQLDGAFRLLALGEVSDASGINPFRGEVEYGIAHATEALRVAREVIVNAKAALSMASVTVKIDSQAGMVTADAMPAAPTALATPPVAMTADGGDRAAAIQWSRVADGHDLVAVTFPVGTSTTLAVHFPGTAGDIIYTPGLMSAPVHVDRTQLAFSKFELALSDGMIGLGGGLYVIKDLGRVHVSAAISQAADVDFSDETAAPDEEATWVFHVVSGTDAQAAAVAAQLNVMPTVWR